MPSVLNDLLVKHQMPLELEQPISDCIDLFVAGADKFVFGIVLVDGLSVTYVARPTATQIENARASHIFTAGIADKLSLFVVNASLFRKLEANSDLSDFERDQDLPALSGSPRQIEWARVIRHKLISQGTVLSDADVMAFVSSKRQSSWWIDNRQLTAAGLLLVVEREILEALKQKRRKTLKKQMIAELGSSRVEVQLDPADPKSVNDYLVQRVCDHSSLYPTFKGDDFIERLMDHTAAYERQDALNKVVWAAQNISAANKFLRQFA